MAAFDPATRLQRLEQQLAAFERLHADELAELQRRLEAYQRLQEDEVRLLRAEIADLRAAIGAEDAAGSSAPAPLAATTAEPLAAGTGVSEPAAAAADPEVVEQATERAVETPLEQTVSRRQLLGGQPSE